MKLINTKNKILTFLALIIISPFAKAQNTTPIPSCENIDEHLYECNAFECNSVNTKGQIHQTIEGLDKDNHCVVIQKMPDSSQITCKYSEESRKFVSINIKKNKNNPFGKNSGEGQLEKALMQEVFMNDCTVKEAEEPSEDEDKTS